MLNWIRDDEQENSIVLSSRVRIARNIDKLAFPHKLECEKGKDVVKQVEDAFYTSSTTEKDFKTYYLWQNDSVENRILFEKHLASYNLLNGSNKSAIILDNKETISIMINEEDHIRIQSITAGLNFNEAYDVADKIDNLLEEKLHYAFDEKFGYLTACPTNIGTALRASVMIHLPALSMSNEMNGVLNALTQVGMTIRGLYGEGSRTRGNLYQISNQVTLGLSEEEIINNLIGVVKQIINQENICREKLLNDYKYELEDRIFRALGITKSAVLLDSAECLNLLSDVRMGIEMNLIDNINKKTLNTLLVDSQPASLQKVFGKKMTEKERNFYRAKLVREKLNAEN